MQLKEKTFFRRCSFSIKQKTNLRKILALSLMIIIFTMVLQPSMDAAAKNSGNKGSGGKSGGKSSGNSNDSSNKKSGGNPADTGTSTGIAPGTTEPIGGAAN